MGPEARSHVSILEACTLSTEPSSKTRLFMFICMSYMVVVSNPMLRSIPAQDLQHTGESQHGTQDKVMDREGDSLFPIL